MDNTNDANSPDPNDGARPGDSEGFALRALRYLDGLSTDEETRQLNEELAINADFRDLFATLSVEVGILNEVLLPSQAEQEETEVARRQASPPKRSWLPSTQVMSALAATLLIAIVGVAWILRPHALSNSDPEFQAKSSATPGVFGNRLESGTTRITLPKVGYVIVDGPAEFNLLDPMRARLNSGRIKMRVTEATGHGFVVETPYGEVTDLGTEFGIDINDKGHAGLVVFEGKVDLRVADQKQQTTNLAHVERLVGGDGVTFDRIGQLDRIMSIVTGKSATFRPHDDASFDDSEPAIGGIKDNLRASDTKRFYEIVRGGFRDDARAFVDRNYEWNGVDKDGLPPFLVGADYILPFNDDKFRQLKVTLSIARPATVYILFDERGTPPKWLARSFTKTESRVGMDEGPGPLGNQRPNVTIGRGAGGSIDYVFSVWKQEVPTPGNIELGAREGKKGARSMYGIVVVPLKSAAATRRPAARQMAMNTPFQAPLPSNLFQ